MRRTRFEEWNCSIARATDVLGDWWTPLVIRQAFYGTRRFDDFIDHLGIGRNILAERLRRLTDEGIFDKIAYCERPARYEYRLTDKGRALFGVIAALHRWGNDWLATEDGPPVEMVDRRTGHVIKPVVVDEETGERLDPRQITVRRGTGFREQAPPR
jgi:DNA-binding HxlR family transcriptional regulator